jgi:hypothetical protein
LTVQPFTNDLVKPKVAVIAPSFQIAERAIRDGALEVIELGHSRTNLGDCGILHRRGRLT